VRDTVISCISDDDNFAKEVFDFLLPELKKQKQVEECQNLRLSEELIRFVAEDNEIYIHHSSLIPKDIIKWILQSFLKLDPTKFMDYDVIEFGDTFTIGKILDPSKGDAIMVSCEICGYFTPYREELYTHRITHFGIGWYDD
jgi:hypothetical protein